MATTASFAERIFANTELAEQIFLHIYMSGYDNPPVDDLFYWQLKSDRDAARHDLAALKSLIVTARVCRTFHATIYSSPRLLQAMHLRPRDKHTYPRNDGHKYPRDDPRLRDEDKKVAADARGVCARLHPLLRAGPVSFDHFTVSFIHFRANYDSDYMVMRVECELKDRKNFPTNAERSSLPSTTKPSWREMMMFDGWCDTYAKFPLKGWKNQYMEECYPTSYLTFEEFEYWLVDMYHSEEIQQKALKDRLEWEAAGWRWERERD